MQKYIAVKGDPPCMVEPKKGRCCNWVKIGAKIFLDSQKQAFFEHEMKKSATHVIDKVHPKLKLEEKDVFHAGLQKLRKQT